MNSFDEARHEFWVGTMTPRVRASEELLADADLGGFMVPDYIAWSILHPGCTRSHGVRPHWFMWQATLITATGHRIVVPIMGTHTFLGAVYEAERFRRDHLPHGWLEGVTGAPEYRGPRAVFLDVPTVPRENLDVLVGAVRRFWRDTVVAWWEYTRAARALHLLARGWDPAESREDDDD